MAGAIIVNYAMARVIASRSTRSRKAALALAVGIDLAVLGLFKYASFVLGSLGWLAQPFGVQLPAPRITLPLGISFFTFHCLSYLIDVYRGRFPANRRLSEAPSTSPCSLSSSLDRSSATKS